MRPRSTVRLPAAPTAWAGRALAVAAVCTAALLVAPEAPAHQGASRGFTSSITQLDPPNLGIFVEVKDGDDRLSLSNTTGQTLIVLGYQGEPYLRFEADGVYQNTRSPAAYLNEERYAEVEVPASADPTAAPEWERVTDGTTWDWHDARIHWMERTDPPQVRALPDQEHHLFDWSVPTELDGKPLLIVGSLDYAPAPPESGTSPLLFVLAALVAAVVLVGAVATLRSRARHGSSSGPR